MRANTVANIFELFSQPTQIPRLLTGLITLCKKLLFSQLRRVTTDGQTVGKVISIAERTK